MSRELSQAQASLQEAFRQTAEVIDLTARLRSDLDMAVQRRRAGGAR